MVRPPPDSTPFPFATLFRSEPRLPARGERLYELVYAVTSDLPRLALELTGAPSVPPRLARALQNAALDARRCLPARIDHAALPHVLLFPVSPPRKTLGLSFAPDPARNGDLAPPA